MGISLSDHITGIFACTGSSRRSSVGRESGEGRRVETSLLQATTAFVAENAARYFDEGDVPSRATRARIAQAYAFVGGDGGPFVVHLSSPPKFWQGLTQAVGRTDLRDDPRFVDRAARVRHYDELQAILGRDLRHRAAPDLARRGSRPTTSRPARSTGSTRSSTTPASRRSTSSGRSSTRWPGRCGSLGSGVTRRGPRRDGRSARRRCSASTARRSCASSASRTRRSRDCGPAR